MGNGGAGGSKKIFELVTASVFTLKRTFFDDNSRGRDKSIAKKQSLKYVIIIL